MNAKKNYRDKNLKHTTVVCVTNQYQCERLIVVGKAIAKLTNTELMVVNVMVSNPLYPNTDALEYLFDISKQNNATMTVCYADDPAKATINFLKEHRATNVVTGLPVGESSVLYKIWSKFTHINFYTVSQDGEAMLVNTKERMKARATV